MRKLRSFLLFSFAITYGQVCFAQISASNVFDRKINLDEAIRLALQNNTQLLSAEQDIIIAKQRVNEAVFLFLPQVSFSGSMTKSNIKYPVVLTPEFRSDLLQTSSFENFYSAGVLVTQPIYKGRKSVNTFKMAQASLKQAQTKYEAVKRDVILNVKQNFFMFLHAQEYLKTSKYWLDKIKSQISKIPTSGWSYIESKYILDDMQGKYKNAQQEVKAQRLNFLEALNKELDSAIEVEGSLEPQYSDIDVSKAIVWAMEFRPELKGEIYKAEMDKIAVNLAMARRSPTILLGVGYDVVGHEFPLPSNSWHATLSVQFPLGYDLWTQIKQKRAEQRQGDLKRADLQDKVRMEVQNSYDKLQYWQEETKLRRDNWKFLNDTYDSISKRQKVSPESMRAAQAVFNSHLSYLQSVKEQLLAKAKLEWSLGSNIHPNEK
jgi:outer membrane protein TolC